MNNGQAKLKRIAISFVVEQFRRRCNDDTGVNNVRIMSAEHRYNIMLSEYDNHTSVRIKIVYSRLIKRSSIDTQHWEFKGVKHNNFRRDKDAINFYMLVGIDENRNNVSIAWLIPANDDTLEKNSFIFIKYEDVNNNAEQYFDNRFEII